VQLYRYFVSQSSEFAAITLCVASERVFVVVVVVVVVVYFVMTQSGNFWLRPHIFINLNNPS
jgi:hypothetical protein